MKWHPLLLMALLSPMLWAQQSDTDDLRYLEDQFYIGLTYNSLLERPPGVNQRSLSYGLQGGFIKDIPINRKRTFALGLGVGYGINSYYSNLVASTVNGGIQYDLPTDIEGFRRSKVETHTLEFPIELRWRNSNPSDYKFWRIYPGIRLGYTFNARSKLATDSGKESFQNDDLQTFQYGAMINLGYNTFNLHVYYGLNALFNDGIRTVDGQALGLKPLRLGLIFYIL